MKKPRCAFVLLLIILALPSFSQDFGTMRNKFMLSWEVALPTNPGFLTDISPVGLRFNYRYMARPFLSVGIAASWNSFDQYYNRKTYYNPDGTGAITSDLVNQLYILPITAEVHYYFMNPESKIHPYAGIGLGAEYSEQRSFFDIYELIEKEWGFVMRPEVGVIYNINLQTGVFLSTAYNFSTNSSDFFSVSNLQNVSFNLGFMYSVR